MMGRAYKRALWLIFPPLSPSTKSMVLSFVCICGVDPLVPGVKLVAAFVMGGCELYICFSFVACQINMVHLNIL